MVESRRAVIASGGLGLEAPRSPLFLPICPATLDEALRALPDNIQTVGHALQDPADAKWLRIVAAAPIQRLVPIARMHHFGPLWDGEEFWKRCFSWTATELA